LDKARRIKEKELAEKKRLQEEEERLRKQREEAEQKYKEYKVFTFVSKIDRVINLEKRKATRNAFTSLVKYNIFIRTNSMKAFSCFHS